MNQRELEQKAIQAADCCLKAKGYISVVDTFMEMGALTKENHENWRFRRVPYLEKVVQMNLSHISVVVKAVQANSIRGKLKPSTTKYMSWGKGARQQLRFTKSGNPYLEKVYATHFVRTSAPETGRMPVPL
jgi:hypothetical protein